MKPISLTMKGFQSFKDEFTFYFPTAPGLYFLRGDNQLEPRLGGNGAGKSTLWAALFWLCFDTTPKGLKASNVANWDVGKGVEVVFEYEREGTRFGVRRTWSPNTWTMTECLSEEPPKYTEPLDLVKSKDNPFLNHLRLGPSAFLHCILMAQRREMFLDLKPEAKVALLSDVLGLDAWIERSATASKKAADQDRISRVLEQRVADLEGQLRTHNATDYTVQAAQWEKDRSGKLDRLAEQHARACAMEKAQMVEADNARIQVDSLTSRWKEAAFELEGLERGARDAGREVDRLSVEAKRLDEAATRHAQDGAALKRWKCPSCGQSLPNIDLEVKSTAHKRAGDKIAADIQATAAALVKADALASTIGAGIERVKRTVASRRMALDEAIKAHAGHAHTLQYTTRDLDRIEDEAERLENEVNPFTALQNTQQVNITELEQRLADAKSDLDDSNTEHALKLMWVRGFKEIRLFDMATALTELEVEVNSSISELGLQDWAINFALDRETAKGDIKRGFTVFVQSPANKRPVPWEVWSGGESQRLRLSGTCGLSDLTRSQSGCSLALEVWDEPTDGLSPEGTTDLLEALRRRAHREQRQVWVVDHHALGYGSFDGVYTVVKDATGSHIIEE